MKENFDRNVRMMMVLKMMRFEVSKKVFKQSHDLGKLEWPPRSEGSEGSSNLALLTRSKKSKSFHCTCCHALPKPMLEDLQAMRIQSHHPPQSKLMLLLEGGVV